MAKIEIRHIPHFGCTERKVIELADNEMLCEKCDGGGRFRVRFGGPNDHGSRDYMDCHVCLGTGKVKK